MDTETTEEQKAEIEKALEEKSEQIERADQAADAEEGIADTTLAEDVPEDQKTTDGEIAQ